MGIVKIIDHGMIVNIILTMRLFYLINMKLLMFLMRLPDDTLQILLIIRFSQIPFLKIPYLKIPLAIPFLRDAINHSHSKNDTGRLVEKTVYKYSS